MWCGRHFRPEFLNRVDEIILFHRLRREHMGTIVEIQLKRLEKLLADRKITLDLDQERDRVAGRQGLRPGLWRAAAEAGIQKELQDPLAEQILLGDILDGSTVVVTAGSDRLNFRPKPAVVGEAASLTYGKWRG